MEGRQRSEPEYQMKRAEAWAVASRKDLPQIRKKQWVHSRSATHLTRFGLDYFSQYFNIKTFEPSEIIKPVSVQFSTGGCREVSGGADADGSLVAPLIGSTQTGLYTAGNIWFGINVNFFLNKHLFGILHAGSGLKQSV